jgi:hypothetical protein
VSAREFETFLARIYVDAEARARFKANPRGEAKRAGRSDEESAALQNADFVGLEMAARSLAIKRQRKQKNRLVVSAGNFLRRIFADCLARFRAR